AAGGAFARVRLREVVEVLLDLEVGGARGQVQGRRRRYRAADVVRRHRHVAHVGHGGDLLDFHEAAAFGDVRLDDVAGLAFEQLAELLLVVQAFAGRHRDTDVPGGLGQGLEVVRRHRLLDPARLERLQVAGNANGGGRAESAVHLDQQLNIGSNG